MIYRTVTVTPELSDNIIVTGEVRSNTVSVTAEVPGNITADAELVDNIVTATAEVADNIITTDARLVTVLQHGDYDYYDGPYEVTPTNQAQTLLTAAKALTGNVIINPIPSNYGLITWNGSTLTVS